VDSARVARIGVSIKESMLRGISGATRPAGQPAGPGPPKIREALVPPKPKEFDST
jgi:hypothetical protein